MFFSLLSFVIVVNFVFLIIADTAYHVIVTVLSVITSFNVNNMLIS